MIGRSTKEKINRAGYENSIRNITPDTVKSPRVSVCP